MNAKLNFLFNRRSVRAYEARPVEEAVVHDLLEAAMAAPSARRGDPWHFIVVRDPARLYAIAQGLPNGKMLEQAPLGIVVCGDQNAACGQALSYLLQDCSAAIENLLLAATALGLGAVWLGVHPREDRILHLSHLFKLPEHIVPVAVVAAGWPAERHEPRTRFDATHVHDEKW